MSVHSVVVLISLCALTASTLGQTPFCAEWNLAADFRASPNQENRNRDSCGNLGVWHFLESDPAAFPAHDPAT
jgi:hypothetical protein